MPNLALTNATIWIGGTDMTSYLNKVSLAATTAELAGDTFATAALGYRVRVPGGLKDTQFSEDGFWQGVPDAAQFAQLGAANQAVTVSAQGTEQSVAYMFLGGQFNYDPWGKIGDVAPFTATMAGTDALSGLVRGQLGAVSQSVSATGQVGSILSLTAVSATQFLYATIHVLSAGTSATIQVQSAALVGFAGPTTRGSFTLTGATGGQWLVRVPGPITDAFFRFNCSAQVGTYIVSGGIGVQ